MKPVLRSVLVKFEPEGVLLEVSYEHGDGELSPGSKKRTTRAARMARAGLQAALEQLDRGGVLWGGFGTDTAVSRDTVLVAGDENTQEKGAAKLDTIQKKIESVRIRDTQDEATREVTAAKLSRVQRRELVREQNRELWIDHYRALAESLALSSAEYQRRAKALEEEGALYGIRT